MALRFLNSGYFAGKVGIGIETYDHKRQGFVSVKSNRGNEGAGTQQESGANYNTN